MGAGCPDALASLSLLPDDLPPLRLFATHPPTFDEIVSAVVAHYGRMDKSIVSHQARTVLNMRTRDVAERLGFRNHSSVTLAHNKVRGRLKVEELLRDDIDIIQRRIADAVIARVSSCQ